MANDRRRDGRLQSRGIFNGREINRLWREHRSRQADHEHRLWQLVMLELWFREFIDTAGGANRQSDLAGRAALAGAAATDPVGVPASA